MSTVYLEKFQLYVPTLAVARDIFAESLELEVIKNTSKTVWFQMNENTKLMCWPKDISKHDIHSYSSSINIFADTNTIQKAHKVLMKKGYIVKLSKLNLNNKQSLELYIQTISPLTLITVSDYGWHK